MNLRRFGLSLGVLLGALTGCDQPYPKTAGSRPPCIRQTPQALIGRWQSALSSFQPITDHIPIFGMSGGMSPVIWTDRMDDVSVFRSRSFATASAEENDLANLTGQGRMPGWPTLL